MRHVHPVSFEFVLRVCNFKNTQISAIMNRQKYTQDTDSDAESDSESDDDWEDSDSD